MDYSNCIKDTLYNLLILFLKKSLMVEPFHLGLILLMLQDTLDKYLTIQKEAKLLKQAQTDVDNRSPR